MLQLPNRWEPLLKAYVCMWQSINVCVSVLVGLAVSDTARCFQKRWASGSPCGNAPGAQHSETPDHGSAPGHTKNTDIRLWPAAVLLPLVYLKSNPTTLPVHVDRPAAGGAPWLPPYHWGHTDQRQSCSPWPGNPHYSWEVTPPALFLTWDEGNKVSETGRGRNTLEDRHSTGGNSLIVKVQCWLLTCRGTSLPPGSGPGSGPGSASQREEYTVQRWPLSLMEIQWRRNITTHYIIS